RPLTLATHKFDSGDASFGSQAGDDGPASDEQNGDPAEELLHEPGSTTPVFYDADRRRWPWFVRFAGVSLFLLGAGFVILLISILALPLMPYNSLPKLATVRDRGNLDPILTLH